MSIPVEQVIELRELRIGNYLEYDGKIVHVTALSLDIDDEYEEQICFCELGKDTDEKGDWNRSICDKLKRVSLTPEIFVRCGFEIDDSHYEAVGYDLQLRSLGSPGEWEIYGYGYPIQLHVHQLQNLIYALSGKELKLTP